MIDWRDCIIKYAPYQSESSAVLHSVPTRCDFCANACGNCRWSEYGVQKPVPGWDAVRRDIPYNGSGIESYIVIDCPEFVLEDQRREEFYAVDWEKARRSAEKKAGTA